jgi:hypothetical protein|tara:strand:+ start:530 stop:727 length:198 start_codon:yes stop_codon:yes gene_type:complete
MAIHIEADPQQLLSFKAPPELVQRIDNACVVFGCNKSSLIRQLLSQGLDQLPAVRKPYSTELEHV